MSHGLFEFHDLVIVQQPKDCVFKKGDAVPFLIQPRGEISLNVILGEIVRQFLEVQCRMRNLELVVIDTMLRILSDTQLFIKNDKCGFQIQAQPRMPCL